MTKVLPLPLLLLLALAGLGASCAGRATTPSEREWARAQCDQVIDSDARKKCLEKADRL